MAYAPGEATPLLTPTTAGPSSKVLSETKVYPLIHLIRVDILSHIDAPLTYEQLLAPDSTYTIIRPLTEKYLALQNQATVFCLLLNKVQFTTDSAQLSIATLSLTRATLCEILASRVLRGWSERSLPLATVLLTPWALFQGAAEEVIERASEEGDGDLLKQTGTALEMAIISGSKRFIRKGIWSGRIIYSALNAHALIADNYKTKPIQMYNPHKAPLLDHYRLKVPFYRSMLEYFNFLMLFILYVVAIEGLFMDKINGREWAFIVYALAFSLDKLATIREHGLKVFSSSLVNGFDLVFMLIYAVYLGARIYGVQYHDQYSMELGADWLAIGAVLMFPRLAFVTLANNLMVLSIRSMLTEFFFLMGVGVFCFLGFVYALFTLGQGKFQLSQIAWWLLEVYFGLDASGFEHAHYFHRFLGPLLMVSYALLSNTLLLTVLVAILGNTFATINADAAAESMFRKAVSTIEGVKADAVFSYQLPFNVVAVVIMWPMRYILNPRWFHKVNVFMIRVTSFHTLLLIAFYERQKYNDQSLLEQLNDFAERYVGSLPRRLKSAAGFDNFASRSDLETVFEIEREVGSFYAGWDDDVDDSEIQLPPTFDPSPHTEEGDEMSDSGADNYDANTTHEHEVFSQPDSEPVSATPSRLEHQAESPRFRRNSMPSPQRYRNQALYPLPSRPRNSSMHGPSPLAQLFVRAPEADERRNRRSSMANMISSNVQPSIPAVLIPPARRRSHSRSESVPITSMSEGEPSQAQYLISSLPRRHKLPLVRPSVASIAEEKSISFSNKLKDTGDNQTATSNSTNPLNSADVSIDQNEPQMASTSLNKQPPMSSRTVRFPTVLEDLQSPLGTSQISRDDSPASRDRALKASHAQDLSIANLETDSGSKDRLEEMEKRQKRMEEMLERLLGRFQSGRE
ncbi:uncharacterized protein L203_103038 [Cryptococcus depauperatus CBS 7841]|uniref:Receptor-activated Ca2+-permeable cation channel n=1 Tax=Cryptococcus depauperatus CBS 7841 TaxID=1295531 RepID=A0AAJ8JST6_9TREE